jgi:hypothetical protein
MPELYKCYATSENDNDDSEKCGNENKYEKKLFRTNEDFERGLLCYFSKMDCDIEAKYFFAYLFVLVNEPQLVRGDDFLGYIGWLVGDPTKMAQNRTNSSFNGDYLEKTIAINDLREVKSNFDFNILYVLFGIYVFLSTAVLLWIFFNTYKDVVVVT